MQGKGKAASVPVEHRAASTGRPEHSTKAVSVGPPRLPAESIAPVAETLKKAARERSTTSWPQLSRCLGKALPDLHPDDRVQVLLRVEDTTAAGEPLLSSLLAAGDARHPALYHDLAARLGRQASSTASEARVHWQAEALRVQRLFRHR
ncbi:hypothetical protein ACFY4B_18205 [Kitasatospora sp. NPDC001261]|uniref:hypothetical protein n=1 Tax=Kitasatospora sp. NPDC001261 TaxID=3364012 RepID=UPI003690C843